MTKPIELSVVKGVRNDVAPERFGRGDLVIGNNIEIDETGKTVRRLGVTRLLAGSMHSLWSAGNDIFAVIDDVLCRLSPDTLAPTQLFSIAGDRVCYVRIADEVFWSDGIASGVIAPGGYRRWGIAPPPAFPASSTGTGTIREGDYLYTMTYVRADGRESGAPISGRLHVIGGITFPSLPVSADPTVVTKRIYLSDWNGEKSFVATTLPNSVASATLTTVPADGAIMRTQFLGAAPAGQVVGYYNGRAYVASGRFLWYSQPFEYELFDSLGGYIAFPTNVQTFAPVSDGIFIGSDEETVFLQGADPQEFVRRAVAGYGTLSGTEQEVPSYLFLDEKTQGPIKLWMSKSGVCMGGNGGEFHNLTGDRYILPSDITTGASLLKIRGGTPQFVTTLFS